MRTATYRSTANPAYFSTGHVRYRGSQSAYPYPQGDEPSPRHNSAEGRRSREPPALRHDEGTGVRRLPIRPDQLPARLRHVRWIGGGSGAGKSTVAGRLAAEHGLHLYHCDETISEHARRSNPTDDPLLHAFMAMDMDERWVNRSPEEMLATFHGFQGEGFDMILEDLLALPEDPPILVEGFKPLPRLVAPLLSFADQAVWLVPTPAFRRFALQSRGSTWAIAGKTGDPERALANLLLRDHLFTEQVCREAAALHLRVIGVDGTLSIAELTRRVAEGVGLGPGRRQAGRKS